MNRATKSRENLDKLIINYNWLVHRCFIETQMFFYRVHRRQTTSFRRLHKTSILTHRRQFEFSWRRSKSAALKTRALKTNVERTSRTASKTTRSAKATKAKEVTKVTKARETTEITETARASEVEIKTIESIEISNKELRWREERRMLVESSDRTSRDDRVSRSAREMNVICNRWYEVLKDYASKVISDNQKKKKENLTLFIVTNNVRVINDD
jgi:hypothetical protein